MKLGQFLVALALVFSATQAIALLVPQENHHHHHKPSAYISKKESRRDDDDNCESDSDSKSKKPVQKKSRHGNTKWNKLEVNMEVEKRDSKNDKPHGHYYKKRPIRAKIPVRVIGKPGAPIVHPLIIERTQAPAKKSCSDEQKSQKSHSSKRYRSRSDKRRAPKKRVIIVGDSK